MYCANGNGKGSTFILETMAEVDGASRGMNGIETEKSGGILEVAPVVTEETVVGAGRLGGAARLVGVGIVMSIGPTEIDST